MSGNTELSIVIPAYNEEKRIGSTLEKISLYLSGKSFSSEIIVVNDGSSDSTSSVLEGYKNKIPQLSIIHNNPNRGKGYSVKKGILQAKGRYIIFSDADMSTPVEEADRFMSAFHEGIDLAIGSRHVAGAEIKVKQPLYRHLMGRFFNLFVRIIALPSISDSQCGFKGFSRECAFCVFQKINTFGYSFDVEVIYLAHKFGFNLKEIPVVWMDSPSSRINPLTDPLNMFIDVIKIRWKHRNTNFSRGNSA
jgi:dolichyl-phosphate beta-glucosyltransferase